MSTPAPPRPSLTSGGVVGMILGDRFLVRNSTTAAPMAAGSTLGTFAGALMGAGVAALTNTSDPNPQLVSGMAAAGGLIGMIATERYVDAVPRRRTQRNEANSQSNEYRYSSPPTPQGTTPYSM